MQNCKLTLAVDFVFVGGNVGGVERFGTGLATEATLVEFQLQGK